MADLMIKLSNRLAERMAGPGRRAPGELGRTLAAFHATLGPPTGTVGEARQYFRIEGVEPGKLEALRQVLERLGDVEAAYVKPADEAP